MRITISDIPSMHWGMFILPFDFSRRRVCVGRGQICQFVDDLVFTCDHFILNGHNLVTTFEPLGEKLIKGANWSNRSRGPLCDHYFFSDYNRLFWVLWACSSTIFIHLAPTQPPQSVVAVLLGPCCTSCWCSLTLMPVISHLTHLFWFKLWIHK